MPQGAAAADGEVGTVGGDASGGFFQDLHYPCPGAGLAHLHQRDLTGLSPQCPPDEHRHAVQPADALTVAGVAVDGDGVDAVLFQFWHSRALRCLFVAIVSYFTIGEGEK